MADNDRLQYLRIALMLVGVIFIVGIYPLTIIWPSGWSWHTGQSDYLQMILGIYATLGVFLIIASKDPLAHRSRRFGAGPADAANQDTTHGLTHRLAFAASPRCAASRWARLI